MLLRNNKVPPRALSQRFIMVGLFSLVIATIIERAAPDLPPLAFATGLLSGISITINLVGLIIYGRFHRGEKQDS